MFSIDIKLAVEKYMIISSAYKLYFMFFSSSKLQISAVYTEYKVGDKTPPCGIPITKSDKSDSKFFTLILIFLLFKYDLNQLNAVPHMPIFSKHSRRFLCKMVSNAAH